MADLKLLNLTDISVPDAGGCCGPDGCACGDAEAGAESAGSATTVQVQVEGMTCSHCVASVTREVSRIPGVDAVDVRLVPGGLSTVTIGAGGLISEEAIRAAVEEAGYDLA